MQNISKRKNRQNQFLIQKRIRSNQQIKLVKDVINWRRCPGFTKYHIHYNVVTSVCWIDMYSIYKLALENSKAILVRRWPTLSSSLFLCCTIKRGYWIEELLQEKVVTQRLAYWKVIEIWTSNLVKSSYRYSITWFVFLDITNLICFWKNHCCSDDMPLRKTCDTSVETLECNFSVIYMINHYSSSKNSMYRFQITTNCLPVQ